MGLLARINRTTAPGVAVLVRIMVGWVFLSEGIQKFLYPADVGAGRFARIGIPWPDVTGPFVGTVEIVCGTLLLMGLLTRLAAIPPLVTMIVAVISTKLPILLGRQIGPFALPNSPYYGLWGMLHAARTDISMILGLVFLLIVGAGRWSMDHRLFGRSADAPPASDPSDAQAARD